MTHRPVKMLKVYVDKVSRLFYFGTIGNNRSNAKLLEELLSRKAQRRWVKKPKFIYVNQDKVFKY